LNLPARIQKLLPTVWRTRPSVDLEHYSHVFRVSIETARVPFDDMVRHDGGEPSSRIRERVVAARERQRLRFGTKPIACNAEIPGNAIRRYCALGGAAMHLLAMASAKRQFSARGSGRPPSHRVGTRRRSDPIPQFGTHRRSGIGTAAALP
jgi:hypothetical protein